MVRGIDQLYQSYLKSEGDIKVPLAQLLKLLAKMNEAISLTSASDAELTCMTQIMNLITSEGNNVLNHEQHNQIIKLLYEMRQVENYFSNDYANLLRNTIGFYCKDEDVQQLLPIAVKFAQNSNINAKTRAELAIILLLKKNHQQESRNVLVQILYDQKIKPKVKLFIARFFLLNNLGTADLQALIQKICSELFANENVDLTKRVKAAGYVLQGPAANFKKQAKNFLAHCMESQPQENQNTDQLKKANYIRAAKRLAKFLPQEGKKAKKALKLLMELDLGEKSRFTIHKKLLQKLKQDIAHNPKVWNGITINPQMLPMHID